MSFKVLFLHSDWNGDSLRDDVGVRNVQDQQANQSSNGIRLSLIPRKQSLVSIANLAASFTIVLTEIYIMLAVFRFIYQVDFGERWQWLMIVTALGSLCDFVRYIGW